MSSIDIYNQSFKYYFVYKTTCIINSKIYIGCHATNDLDDGYIGSGTYLLRAIKKHGIVNFNREVLHHFDTAIDMFEKEKSIVDACFIEEDTNYNLVVGGLGGYKVIDSEAWKTKLKISSANRINKQPMLGKHHSEETKKKMSIANIGHIAWNKGLPGTWIGKTHSDESKKMISKNRTGLTAGKNNPMYGKSAVAGRKWYNDGTKTYYLFPSNPATETLVMGRLKS